MRALVAVALLGVALIVAGRPSATAVHRPVGTGPVLLYADSLGWEAQTPFHLALEAAGQPEVTYAAGGSAICDWLAQMRGDAARLRPRAVVVEFSGNDITSCMGGVVPGSPAYYAKYAADAREVVAIFGAATFFVGTPISRSGGSAPLDAMYRAIAGAKYIDAGAAVLDNGRWTYTLPCLPAEPCTGPGGRNVVRSPDGAHFCPDAPPAVRGVVPPCPMWSSGAYRFGTAMARPVISMLAARAA